MKDELGDRMKTYYEDRSRTYLPRRTYTMIRIDGKAFHTYTRGLKRPFDADLIKDMDETTKYLCDNIQGAKFGYVQSDEISILLSDFEKTTTSAWFDGNVQKMASISSSLATAKFNQLRLARWFKETALIPIAEDIENFKTAMFDSRLFTIPPSEEVINYFIWRQQDATRNSIQAVAQSLYSHKELNGKSTDQLQDLIWKKGQNWNDYPVGQKRGRVILKQETWVALPEDRAKLALKNPKTADNVKWLIDDDQHPNLERVGQYYIKRNTWQVVEPPIFTQDKDFLRNLIPVMW